MLLLLTGMTASLSNSSPGQKSVPEMVVQEYPECAENATVIGSDTVEAVEDECAGADDMLPPPQALHTSKPASARMLPPPEIFTVRPPQPYGCKRDAIAKSRRSSPLAVGNGMRFATVEDVCHYFSGQCQTREISRRELGRESSLAPTFLRQIPC